MKALYKWFAYKLPIRSKLLISFSILVMVPILVLGIYSYQQSKENTERQIRSTMESNLARLTSELDTRFQREGSTVRFLAYNLTFRNALENSGASAMTMAQVMNTSVEPTFWYFIAGDSYVKGMEVYSTKVRDKIGNFLLPVDDAVSQQAWYRQALDSYATHWTYDGAEICANRAILDTNSSSEVIAVLRMFCYPASLLDATDSMDYLDNGIRIVDETGQTVYARNSGVDALDEAVRLLAEDGSETATLEQGVLYKSRMEVSGWSIYYYLDKANITKELQPILNTTILVFELMEGRSGMICYQCMRVSIQAEPGAYRKRGRNVFTICDRIFRLRKIQKGLSGNDRTIAGASGAALCGACPGAGVADHAAAVDRAASAAQLEPH